MKRLVILSLLALAGCSNSNDTNALRPKVYPKPQTCDEFRKSLPADVVTKTISVPEHEGSSKMVQVFYFYREPLRSKVALFLNGGPGGTVHGSFRVMEAALKNFGLQDKISFIYMDQRGNGCSSGYPDESTDAGIFERAKDYGSRGIVNDAEAIRKALGFSKWAIYGQSYGAMIAHRYAILYPNSLERVIAYANTVTPDRKQRLSERIASQLDVWSAYFKMFPGDEPKVQLLFATLSKDKCVKVDGEDECGVSLVDNLVGGYLGWHDEWPKLHQWFERLVVSGRVDQDALQDLANLDLSEWSYARSRSLSAINYYDRNVEFINAPSCSLVRSTLPAAFEFDRTLTECSASMQMGWSNASYTRVDAYFAGQKDEVTLTDLKASLATKPKAWFRLYSADLDPYVPARSFATELAEVGDLLTYTNFTDVGHDGFYSKREVLDDLLR